MPAQPSSHEDVQSVESVQDHTPIPQLPKPPSPSTDPGVSPDKTKAIEEDDAWLSAAKLDIFTLSAVAALRLLCRTIETLVRITEDVPPTPTVGRLGPTGPNGAEKNGSTSGGQPNETSEDQKARSQDHDDVPPRAKTPIGSPEARPTEPLHVGFEPIDLQHGIIIRKFYSKKPPGISLEEYLLRVHQYCPLTTGVYLATSLFIHRLAVVERVIPVTARNAHRLVLAGLRVSMKKLEDYRYSHSRFAKVGGVSMIELAKLEVSFCFLTNFDLKANEEMLTAHAATIRDTPLWKKPTFGIRTAPPANRHIRKASHSKAIPDAVIQPNAPAAA